MIRETVAYIRREIAELPGIDITEVVPGDVHRLKEDVNQRGIYVTVVNLQEESALRNVSHQIQRNNAPHYQEPPVFLNVYLLFSFDFDDYDTSLMHLAQVIELFQNKRVFSVANELATNAFPANLEKLIFDFSSLDFEQLNHLWGVLGGTYLPSVLYKVRMVEIQQDATTAAPVIDTIQVDTHQQ